MQPGTPGADELESGSVIPLEQTSISVQFDQVLTTLQAPVRDNLQVFLKEFGDALDKYGGAEGFRESFRTSPAAYKYTAQVNEAFLGTEPGDLAGLIVNLDRTVRALNQDQVALQDLVTNLRIFTGSFAAESESLELAIAELPVLLAEGRPALQKLNASFPALRAFSREALPGVHAANRALPAAIPWMFQARKLISKPELRGLVKDLRPTVPSLARLARASLPFLEESRALSSCFNLVVIPWSNLPVPSNDGEPNDPVYKQTGYGLVGVGGREPVRGRAGAVVPSARRRRHQHGHDSRLRHRSGGRGRPVRRRGRHPGRARQGSAAKTPFHPDAPCENQDLPELSVNLPTTVPTSTSASSSDLSERSGQVGVLSEQYAAIYTKMLKVEALKKAGFARRAAILEAEVAAAFQRFAKFGMPAYRKAVDAADRGRWLMSKAIRDHLRDFLAIIGLVLVGVVATWIIVQNERLRIPVLEERPFELKAEMETGAGGHPRPGADRPGGGRAHRRHRRKVEYEDGSAVVTMDIDHEFLPVYQDATILLRPKTGLKDMFLELDPGTQGGGRVRGGGHDSRSPTPRPTSTSTRCSSSSIPTRAPTCACCWSAPARASTAVARISGEVFEVAGPDQPRPRPAQLARSPSAARASLGFIHNMNIFTERVGYEAGGDRRASSTPPTTSLGAIASQDPDVRRAVGLLGPTLRETRIALSETNELADDPRPGAEQAAALRAQAGAGQRVARPAGADNQVGHQERDPAVRANRPADRPQPAPGRQSGSRTPPRRLTVVGAS